MGGKDGLRGYYYQLLSVLLESIEDDSWESIKIEPHTEEDKVDIEWIFTDRIECVQVKSSFNNFERHMLINWTLSLVSDSLSAYGQFGLPIKHTLYLIGSTDKNADKWISDLHGGRLVIENGEKLKAIEEELESVAVIKHNFNFEALEGLAYYRMQVYIERNGMYINSENVKMLCNTIIGELLNFTMKNRAMTKSLFKNLLNKFIGGREHGITEISRKESKLSLVFYEKDKVSENISMTGIKLDNIPLLDSYRKEASEYLHKVQSIKLPKSNKKVAVETKSTRDPEGITKDDSLRNFLENVLSENEFTSVQMSEDEAFELRRLSESKLNIVLMEEDFCFGDLEKKKNSLEHIFDKSHNRLRGSEQEQEKFNLMENAYAILVCYEQLEIYNSYLKSCHPIPFVLKNTGTIVNEDIQVTLKFPNTAFILSPKIMRAPLRPFIEDFVTDAQLFDNLIMPLKDYSVLEFTGASFRMPVLPKFNLPHQPAIYTEEDFEEHLENIFQYEYFNDDGHDIVQYNFKSLNPSQRMAFPTFLLVQTDEDMDIEYIITSKQLELSTTGTLKWFHPKVED